MEQHEITGAELFDLIYQLRYCCTDQDEQIRATTELSPAEYRGLNSIEANSTMSASQFAKQTNLSPSRSSRVIEKMEKAGYIATEQSQEDRRSIVIRLTNLGVEMKESIALQTQKCHKKIDDNLNASERIALAEGIQKLLTCL